MASYLPVNDEQLVTWMQNYTSVLAVHAADLDVSVDELAALSTNRTALDNAITDQEIKYQTAKAATAAKRADRATAVDLVRKITQRILVSPNMTDEIKAQLGITAPSKSTNSLEIGEEIPMLYLEGQPGRISVHFGIAVQGERSRQSKPHWATTCVIYRKKTGETEFRLLGSQKSSPFIDLVTGPAADYTYIARYQGRTSADLGAQSQLATIAARGELAA